MDFLDLVLCLAFSLTLGIGLWGFEDTRSVVIFFSSLGVCEAFVYLRWRFSVVCSACGFDPVLYQRSPEKARLRVARFYERHINDPRFMLSRSPILDVYRQNLAVQKRNHWIKEKTKMEVPVRDAIKSMQAKGEGSLNKPV